MKIQLVSDIHWEFGNAIVPENKDNVDVLILAGDICTVHNLFAYEEHWKQVSKQYPHVLYVLGNHEHYHYDISRTKITLNKFFEDNEIGNVHILDNDMWSFPFSKKVPDTRVRFFGTTLWTDCNNRNPITTQIIQNSLSDFRLITTNNQGRRFTANDSIDRHEKDLEAIKIYLNASKEINKDKPIKIVMITHHAPSWQSIHEKYKTSDINPGFASNLDQMILEYPEIAVWVHGHVHNSFDYNIGTTRMIANPAGYPRRNHLSVTRENHEFNPNLVFEV